MWGWGYGGAGMWGCGDWGVGMRRGGGKGISGVWGCGVGGMAVHIAPFSEYQTSEDIEPLLVFPFQMLSVVTLLPYQ